MNPFSLGDIDYTLHDGTPGTIDLSQLSGDSTLGNVIQQINSQSDGKLQASLLRPEPGGHRHDRDRQMPATRSRSPMPTGSTAASDLGLVNSTTASSSRAARSRAAEHRAASIPERRHGRAGQFILHGRHRLHAAQRHFGHDRSLRPNDPGRRHPANRQPEPATRCKPPFPVRAWWSRTRP